MAIASLVLIVAGVLLAFVEPTTVGDGDYNSRDLSAYEFGLRILAAGLISSGLVIRWPWLLLGR